MNGFVLRTAAAALATVLVVGCAPKSPPLNLIVITLDTTRADHLSCYGYPAPLTPHLDAFAKRSVLFENTYPPMPETLPSHATLFTGRDPREHGALENFYRLAPDETTMAEWLGARGYRTSAIIGANVLSAESGVAQGFATFETPDESVAPWRRGSKVTDAVLTWADTQAGSTQPFMLWAHYFDAHEVKPTASDPGLSEETIRRTLPPSTVFMGQPMEKIVNFWHAYSNAVAYLDEQVGRMLDGMAQRGLLEHTVVLIVGDHGEALGENNAYGHGWHVYEPMLRVPMLLALPGGELAGTRVSETARIRDALPTLMTALGQDTPPEVSGLDLLPALRAGRPIPDRPTFVERPHISQKRIEFRFGENPPYDAGFFAGVIVAREKLVRYPDGTEALFDLAADPHELSDVGAARPKRRAQLASLLTEWDAQDRAVDRDAEDEASASRHRALLQLGY